MKRSFGSFARPLTALLGLVALSFGLALAVAQPAGAIPAFARKYQFSCTTCHSPFPRLKAYGEEFAGNGFRLADASQEPTRATLDSGDPLLKLPREMPLAFRLEGFASWKEDAAAESDLEWPWVFKILSGGPIHDKISYYFYFLTERGEVVGLEDAYLQFNRVFGQPVDLLVGQFQVCDPLFKRELRLERFDYDILTTRVGESGLNLTYDRGLVAAWHAPAELEVVAQIVNGNGIGAVDEERNFDDDKYKNASLRVTRHVGKARLGAFGYYGKQEGAGGAKNETYYFGPDLVIEFDDRLTLAFEYLERRDDNPFFEDEGTDYETRGGFAELQFFPQGADGRWVFTPLYNKVDSDDENARRESVSLTANYLLVRNVRLLAEFGRDVEREASRATIGVISAY